MWREWYWIFTGTVCGSTATSQHSHHHYQVWYSLSNWRSAQHNVYTIIVRKKSQTSSIIYMAQEHILQSYYTIANRAGSIHLIICCHEIWFGEMIFHNHLGTKMTAIATNKPPSTSFEDITSPRNMYTHTIVNTGSIVRMMFSSLPDGTYCPWYCGSVATTSVASAV